MIYSIDLLQHAASRLHDWGPFWSYSKFIFKSSNTSLLDLCNVMLGFYTMSCRTFAVYGNPPVLVGKYPDGF